MARRTDSAGQESLLPNTGTYGFKPTTKNGYELGIVVSALQKEIRRCNEMRAMFWAYELFPKYHKYFWRRLGIIACEELAWDDPAIQVVSACRDSYYFEEANKSKGLTDMHYVARAVLFLARRPKSREVNDYFAVVHHYSDNLHKAGGKLEMAEYAIDGHTDKRLNKLQTWWEYSRRIFNHAIKPNRYFKAIFEYEGTPYKKEWIDEEIAKYDKFNEDAGLPTQPFNGAEKEAE